MDEAEQALVGFLKDCAAQTELVDASQQRRVRCETCNASRSLYCFDCLRLLLPRKHWPPSLLDGSFRLPFGVDLVLDDKRAASTGVQVATLLHCRAGLADACGFRLIDVERGDTIPSYDDDDSRDQQEEDIFLLFPGPSSVSLSSVVPETETRCMPDDASSPRRMRLVVLDCKWTKSSLRLHPSLACLRQVHLDPVPQRGYFWRWHSMPGEGRLSTVEAIYWSAWTTGRAMDWNEERLTSLLTLLWLFGWQRQAITKRYEQDASLPPHLPFTEDGKEYQRELRRRKGKGEHTEADDVASSRWAA